MREIMDTMTASHPCQEGGLQKGTQIAGTESFLNAAGSWMDDAPGPILIVMPTTDMAKLHSKQRVDPMIENTPALKRKVRPSRSRDSGNTVLVKKYRGGILRITGANSGPGLRSMPVRYLLMDEIDGYLGDAQGEGDPTQVAEKRTDTFGMRKKVFRASTPKLKATSRMDRYYKRGTQARYYVPCPHCLHEQWLRWEQMRWEMTQRQEHACTQCGGITPIGQSGAMACQHCGVTLQAEQIRTVEGDEVARVWYECEACQGEIDERHKTAMFVERRAVDGAGARHIHHVPPLGRELPPGQDHKHAIWVRLGDRVVRWLPDYEDSHRPLTWHVSGLYSPLGWFSWKKAVIKHLEALAGGFDDETGEPLEQVFENTIKGEAWAPQRENELKHTVLQLRAEPYPLGIVPAGGLFLTGWVDVQGNRLEYLVKAWGRGEESWTVDYGQIYGDPAHKGPESVWFDLEKLRSKGYLHAGGQTLQLVALGVDCNYLTDQVHDHVRRWSHRQVIATRGEDGAGKPVIGRPRRVDTTHEGRVVKKGAQYWPIGTDTAKERLFKDLGIETAGPGYMHFSRELPTEYFEQLTAEKMMVKRRQGREHSYWVKTRERNEVLDMEVGNRAVAMYAGIKRVNWDQLERAINPQQQDLFAAKPKATDAPAPGEAEGANTRASSAEPASPVRPPAPLPQSLSRRSGFVMGWRP